MKYLCVVGLFLMAGCVTAQHLRPMFNCTNVTVRQPGVKLSDTGRPMYQFRGNDVDPVTGKEKENTRCKWPSGAASDGTYLFQLDDRMGVQGMLVVMEAYRQGRTVTVRWFSDFEYEVGRHTDGDAWKLDQIWINDRRGE